MLGVGDAGLHFAHAKQIRIKLVDILQGGGGRHVVSRAAQLLRHPARVKLGQRQEQYALLRGGHTNRLLGFRV